MFTFRTPLVNRQTLHIKQSSFAFRFCKRIHANSIEFAYVYTGRRERKTRTSIHKKKLKMCIILVLSKQKFGN